MTPKRRNDSYRGDWLLNRGMTLKRGNDSYTGECLVNVWFMWLIYKHVNGGSGGGLLPVTKVLDISTTFLFSMYLHSTRCTYAKTVCDSQKSDRNRAQHPRPCALWGMSEVQVASPCDKRDLKDRTVNDDGNISSENISGTLYCPLAWNFIAWCN